MPLRGSRLALAAAVLALAACKGEHGGQTTPEAAPEPTPVARTPAEIRRDGNHLVGSGSTYLLEHAHNPVDWYPWSPETLALARAQDRPIFLSIGYSSCHWCHVMAAEVFEDDEVAATLNAHFVSIKVDREERPDLDAVFMGAVQAMNGSGGWPMSLFLTPGLQPFFGATYLPRERFLAVARRASAEFSSARADVETRAADVARRIASDAEPGPGEALGPNELHAIATAALDRVDPQWGGFRGTTKFPVPVEWTFLLHTARKWGDESLITALRTTLDAMASGGIRDPIGGGFHRYSTDPRWEVPHFEKMLYDNAQLASLYLEAGAALGERRYVAVAVDTLDFLLREMEGPSGGFSASLDADSGGREGAYYAWTTGELRAVAGPTDAEGLARLLGVTEGRASPVNRRASPSEVAAKTGSTVAAVNALWERWRPALLAARAARPRPHLDPKVVTAWNGLAISALVRGFEATGDVRYRDAALRTADLLWRVHRRPAGGLSRASNAGRAGEAGVLEDYAFLAGGLVALFEATGRLDLIDDATTLVKEARDRFGIPGGGWYDAEQGSTPLARTVSRDDSVEPSGSSALLHAMIALSALTLRQDLSDGVDGALAREADGMRRRGLGAAGWLDAALLRAGPYYDVVVSADAGAGEDLESVWRGLGAPWTVGTRVPAAGPEPAFLERVAASMGKTSGSGRARAFVCSQGSCKAPVDNPRALRAGLLDGWRL